MTYRSTNMRIFFFQLKNFFGNNSKKYSLRKIHVISHKVQFSWGWKLSESLAKQTKWNTMRCILNSLPQNLILFYPTSPVEYRGDIPQQYSLKIRHLLHSDWLRCKYISLIKLKLIWNLKYFLNESPQYVLYWMVPGNEFMNIYGVSSMIQSLERGFQIEVKVYNESWTIVQSYTFI